MYIVKVAYDFIWIAIIIHCTNARKITNCHCFFQSPFYLLFPAFQTPFWIIQELMIRLLELRARSTAFLIQCFWIHYQPSFCVTVCLKDDNINCFHTNQQKCQSNHLSATESGFTDPGLGYFFSFGNHFFLCGTVWLTAEQCFSQIAFCPGSADLVFRVCFPNSEINSVTSWQGKKTLSWITLLLNLSHQHHKSFNQVYAFILFVFTIEPGRYKEDMLEL